MWLNRATQQSMTTNRDAALGAWILWQDGSINYDDQVRYVDLAAAMGYEYVLVDNWWDKYIGRERMEQAHQVRPQ